MLPAADAGRATRAKQQRQTGDRSSTKVLSHLKRGLGVQHGGDCDVSSYSLRICTYVKFWLKMSTKCY